MKNSDQLPLQEQLNQLRQNVEALCKRQTHLGTMLTAAKTEQEAIEQNTQTVRDALTSLQAQLLQTADKQRSVAQATQCVSQTAASEQLPEETPQQEVLLPADPEGMANVPDDTPSQHKDNKQPKNWEVKLGVHWLSRIGIVALLIGIAMAINYSFSFFGPALKILSGFVIAGLFYMGGHKLHTKIPLLGRILQAGGLSIGYVSVFAIFFMPNVQLIDNTSLGLGALLAYVGLMMAVSLSLKSESVAILSLLFGYYTACYAQNSVVSLLSAVGITVAVILLSTVYMNWRLLKKLGLIGAFVTYLYWQVDAYWFLDTLFILFHFSSFIPTERRDTALNLLTTFGCYALYEWTGGLAIPDGALELGIAGTHFASLFGNRFLHKRVDPLGIHYGFLITGFLFVGLATLQFLDGVTLPAALAAESMCLGLLSKTPTFTRVHKIGSGLFLGLSVLALLIEMIVGDASSTALLWTCGWIVLVGTLLEHWVYQGLHIILRSLWLFALSALWCITLSVEAPGQWITFGIITTGLLALGGGFLWQQTKYRWLGLAWLLVGIIRLIIVDLIFLETLYKIVVFLVLGAGLIGGSYGYSILQERQDKDASPPSDTN